ncbi:molybdopterin converting factor subunit 1 [Litchfieldia alkalitelluris]|uniref:molybdopterin converting factor subunit 1 n=1 Tax=Litchfieldia alkalitelluris TaxID=304268 RepID=UPI0009980BC1|nr:molybdopterin converting factor subunit 1 [Litchfieldia alkalitelluris]
MITVLLFAHLQEVLGKEKIEIDCAPLTVAELKQYLKESFGFEQISQVMIAINEEYGVDEDVIQPGDIVALIPPVSGG